MQRIIVLALCIFAVIFLYRRFKGTLGSKAGCGSGCGCSGAAKRGTIDGELVNPKK